jgi:hypothetical protein
MTGTLAGSRRMALMVLEDNSRLLFSKVPSMSVQMARMEISKLV